MKHNWEYKKLGDVCTIERGGSPRPIEKFITDDPNGLNWIKIGDAVEGSKYITSTKEKIKPEGLKKTRLVHKGDFILSNSMSFGRPYILDIDGCIHDGWLVIHDENKVFDKIYLYYLLSSPNMYSEFKRLAVGGVVNNLNSQLVRNVSVAIPPLDEQSRIVAELDLLTGIIDKQNAQLKELDNLAQAIFYDMFGDLSCDECALIELCVSKDDIKCGPFGTQLSKSEYQKEGVAVWGIPQINSHFIIPPSDYVSQEKAVALKDYSVVAGDIVMSRKGNVGQCSVFPDSFENGIIHSDVLRLRLDYDKANSIFMMYQLHLSDSIKHQIQLVSSGAIMPGINVTKLKNIKVQVPPLALQQSFAEKIQSIEKQKEAIRASIADTQKLLDYTMDKYFG